MDSLRRNDTYIRMDCHDLVISNSHVSIQLHYIRVVEHFMRNRSILPQAHVANIQALSSSFYFELIVSVFTFIPINYLANRVCDGTERSEILFHF